VDWGGGLGRWTGAVDWGEWTGAVDWGEWTEWTIRVWRVELWPCLEGPGYLEVGEGQGRPGGGVEQRPAHAEGGGHGAQQRQAQPQGRRALCPRHQ
jgi:hypothetical protein